MIDPEGSFVGRPTWLGSGEPSRANLGERGLAVIAQQQTFLETQLLLLIFDREGLAQRVPSGHY